MRIAEIAGLDIEGMNNEGLEWTLDNNVLDNDRVTDRL